MNLTNNIIDTALIFEGGGMRASYTAGFLNTLLENELYFDYVAGISAGASHSVNYLSRDTNRAKKSFVDFVLDPNFGGWHTFFRGKGFFNAKYIYEETPYPNAALPFDFATFQNNPAKLKIGMFDREKGKLVYFSKENMDTLGDLMKIVRGSSSLPIFMPPAYYKDRYYMDGGIAGGIALDIAKKDGLKKYFVVLSRPKGYRKEPIKFTPGIKAYYHKYPQVIEAMMRRHIVYNQTIEELETLEDEGKAFLVYPDTMPVSNREIDIKKLEASYSLGYAQGSREVARWKKFLEIEERQNENTAYNR